MTPAVVTRTHFYIITWASLYLCFIAPDTLLHEQVASLILAVALTGWLRPRWYLVPLTYVPAAYFLASNLREHGLDHSFFMPVVFVLATYLIVFLTERYARPPAA
jgi:hypothetical protein